MTRADDFLKTFSALEDIIISHAQNLPEKYYEKAKKPFTVDASLNTLRHYRESVRRNISNKVKNESDFRVLLENIDQLFLCNKLRNALAHNFDDPPIADPRQDIVDFMNAIHAEITNPKTAANIMTKKVRKTNTSENIYDVVDDMDRNNFTNVPVVEGGKVVAVLSERSALKWIAATKDDDVKLAEVHTVWDVERYLDDINAEDSDVYVFVAKNLNIYSVQDIFDEAIKNGRRVGALFVTNSGSHNESLLGIITAWDLYR